MSRKYTLTRAQHALLIAAMREEYAAHGWYSAMIRGKSLYKELCPQK
ncbi:hypothetical protein SA126VB_76 [Escherichia phage vB_EcoS_SA126VB]|nr:hypothetical protein SA126VB_76 [Escherichia phage vB_EcoS_SA126VB]